LVNNKTFEVPTSTSHHSPIAGYETTFSNKNDILTSNYTKNNDINKKRFNSPSSSSSSSSLSLLLHPYLTEIVWKFNEFISFDLCVYKDFSNVDDLNKIISFFGLDKIIGEYDEIDLNKKKNSLKFIEKDHINELIIYLENNEEKSLIHQICLILLMNIIIGSYFEENNEFNCFIISGEIININGIDRLINIFNNYSNNYLKLFICIIISSILKNLPIPKRCLFIYEYLKNHIIFYYEKSTSPSLSSSCFSDLFPFSDSFIEEIHHHIDNCFNDLGEIINLKNNKLNISNKKEKHIRFVDSIFSSINNEKILFYSICGLFSILSNENSYKKKMIEDSDLFFQLFCCLISRCNNETKEILTSVIYKIIEYEENNKKNLIEKNKIIYYLIEIIEENNINNNSLECLLFICKNSPDLIKLLMENERIELLEKIIKIKLLKLFSSYNNKEIQNSKRFFSVYLLFYNNFIIIFDIYFYLI
jgi:hypothetical protein